MERRAIASRSATSGARSILLQCQDTSLITGGHPWPLRAFLTNDLRLQFHEVDEDVSLPPQLIGDHWRPAFYRRHDGDANPATLQGFDQRTKIAIPGKQDDLIEVIGQLHRVDRKFNAYVALQLTAALAIVMTSRPSIDASSAFIGSTSVTITCAPIPRAREATPRPTQP